MKADLKWRLDCGLTRRAEGIWMMHAYADDSASDEHRVLVYAAYVASREAWDALWDEWEAFRQEPPSVEYLKMREAFARNGEFKRTKFSEEQRDEKVCGFCRIIRKHVRGAAVTGLPLKPFAEIVRSNQGVPKPYKNKHFFLMYNLMHDILRFGNEESLSWPISFVFDDQSRGKPQIVGAWDSFKHGAPINKERFGRSPTFDDDTKVPPLQAADLLAWTFRRWVAQKLEKKPDEHFPWMQAECSPLLGIKRSERFWNNDGLKTWVDGCLKFYAEKK